MGAWNVGPAANDFNLQELQSRHLLLVCQEMTEHQYREDAQDWWRADVRHLNFF